MRQQTTEKCDSQDGGAIKAYFEHSSAQRVNTNVVMARSLQAQHPKFELVMVLRDNCSLFEYADSTGKATYHAIDDENLLLTKYNTPLHRTDPGDLGADLLFGKFRYTWNHQDFNIYYADGRDGTSSYPSVDVFYILTRTKQVAEGLVAEAGRWTSEIHNEVWMFDQGRWQKSKDLFDAQRKASWDNVILDDDMKKTLIEDHTTFFKSKDRYEKLQVPWKRGVIYYGPPGNGKTISIKAMMHLLYSLPEPIPTLYVRSLKSVFGPEYSIKQIFDKARGMSPCYLVLEDLDSLISDDVRSYFLNEVDGLKSNDGIFMVGSTNHLDRLDEGVSKRPSRFDRKYLFSDPIEAERVAYCHFWQKKLSDNKDIEFPDILCKAIAGITDKFSFAYMQEAFVATLLAIARRYNSDGSQVRETMEKMDGDWLEVKPKRDDDEDLDKYILWTEMKKQVKALRGGIKGEE